MVERSLSMREVRGSIPRTSNYFLMKKVTITEIDNYNKDLKEHCKSLSFQLNLNDILFNCIIIKDLANELGKL